MPKADGFTSLKCNGLVALNENANESSGVYIIPSESVIGRDSDITGYVLTSSNENGKLLWADPNLGTLPPALQSIANLNTSGNEILYTISSNTYDTSSISASGRSFISLNTPSEQQSALGLTIGVDVQAYSSDLDLLSLAPSVSDNLIVYTTGNTYSTSTLTPYIRNNILTATSNSELATELGFLTADGDFGSNLTAIPKINTSSSLIPSGITIDASDNITFPATINGVTPTEFSQLSTINSVTISNTQWGYLGSLDQSLATSDTPTFTGLNANSSTITNLADPTLAQEAATKNYVDTTASTGAPPLESVNYATTTVLPDTPNYASPAQTLTSVGGPGTLLIDSQTVNVSERILIKDQADTRENGVYVVTDDGATPGPNWVLTRSSDFNQAAMPLGAGTSVFVEIVSGASNSASTYALQSDISNIDPLTDDVLWVQIGGTATFTAGSGIDPAQLGGGIIQIDNTARFTFSGNELELNTVTVPFGGTGQTSLTNNGVLIGQGVGNVDTSKSAPTGDFVGTSDTQTLTNKVVTSSTNNVTSRALFSNNGSNTVSVFASPNPVNGQVLTATSGTTAVWQTPSSGVSYSRTLTVSPTNSGISPDWQTVEDALADAVTLTPTITNQILIIVYPGRYVENTPLIIPSFVTLSGQVSTQNSVQIIPTAPAPIGTVISMSNQSRMYGILIDGNDDAGGFSTIGILANYGSGGISYLNSVTVQNCSSNGLSIEGDGTQFSTIIVAKNISVLITQPFPFTTTNGILLSQGAVLGGEDLSISGFLSGGGIMTNGINITGDYTYADISSIGLSSLTNGFTIGTGVTSNYILDYAKLRVVSGSIGFYTGRAFNILQKSNVFIGSITIDDNEGTIPNQIPLYIENPVLPAEPNQIIANGFLFRTDLATFLNGAANNPPLFIGEFINSLLSEPQTNISGNFSVGTPTQGYELIGGGGNSHTFGVNVFIDNGGVFTDVTNESKLENIIQARINTDLATTVAIDLTSAPATIDGVAPTSGVSRILVKDGSTANPGVSSIDNGIYLWNGTGNAMTRTTDFQVGDIFPATSSFSVNDGDTNYRSFWNLTNNNTIVGTSNIQFQPGTFKSFPDVPVNNDALYIGSTLGLTFPGIKIGLTAPLEVSTGDSTDAVVWEYWNGITWSSLPLMSTLSNRPYTRKQNLTFAFSDTILEDNDQRYQYRFGRISDWETTTVNGVIAYWVRSRVIDSSIITQIPVVEQIKIHTNRSEINSDGFLEFFGNARALQLRDFNTNNGIATSYTNPQNEQLLAATDGTNEISFNLIDCQYNNNTDTAMGWNTRLPVQIDTSISLKCLVTYTPSTVGTGNISFRIDYTYIVDNDTLNGTPTPEFFSTGIVTSAAPGVLNQVTTAEFLLPIETLPIDELFWFQVRRNATLASDTYSGNIFILNVALEYGVWCSGRYESFV